MASTKSPIDALVYIKNYMKQMPIEKISTEILDEVNKIMWMAAPWRWTLGSLTATTVTSNTQDYTITVPADFLFLFDGFISDGDRVYRDLIVEPTLPSDVKIVGNTSRIAYMGSNTFRTTPKSGTVPASPVQQMILRYKKIAPVFTASNIMTAGTQIFDDEWFWVFSAGVLWRAYQWGDDQRAGGATLSPQGPQYTGQLAVFRDGLRIMAEHEKLPLVEPHDMVNPKQVNK